jgi:hypothetical protein
MLSVAVVASFSFLKIKPPFMIMNIEEKMSPLNIQRMSGNKCY